MKQNRFGDRYFEEFTGAIFESNSAAAEFEKRFGNALFQENTLYVIVGSDAGLLPRYIISHGLPRGSRYLFVEVDEIKHHLDGDLIHEELADRMAISDKAHWSDQASELALLNYTFSGKISYVRSCAVQQAIHPSYPALAQLVDRELRHLFWLFTAQFDAHVFINSQLANLAENRIPVIRLKEQFKGNSAIILGAGPSLDELIPWIRAHRHEVLLIAVSRIAPRLIETGLEPDMVISIDPQFVSFSVSKGMFNLGPRTLFINGSHTTPLLLGQWPHRNLFLGPRLPWHDEGFYNIGTIAPTVTNNAILLAQALGCGQIILAGVDLCYSADGYTHARGTQEHAAGPMIGKIDYTVKTNSGAEAETNKGYHEAIKVISEQAQEASQHGCRIINPAASAASIAGVDYIPPAEIVITEPLVKPAWETITALLDDDSSARRCSHYSAMAKMLEKAASDLRWIRRLCNEALKCNSKMAALLNTPGYSRYKKQMERIEQRLDSRFETMSTTIKQYNSSGFAKIISADSGDDWSAAELFDKTKIYYEEFIHGATILGESIADARERLLSRLEEESSTPDFERLFNQWHQDMQFGRARLWMERNPQRYEAAPAEVKRRIEILLSQFNALITTDARNFEQSFQALLSDANTFGAIVENGLAYLAKRDQTGLERITRGLSKRPEPLAIQSNLLLQGFIKELEGDYHAAGGLYHAIDASISAELQQIALERIVNYSLEQEQYQTTLAALKLLSDKRAGYQPFYARLLALTGSVIEAIETYTSYLQQQPHDLDTTLELGLLLADAGAHEAAESALEHIKGIDPNHPGIGRLAATLKRD